MNEVVFLLGSNLDDKLKIIQVAVKKLEGKIGELTKQSSVYETAAWGNEDQPSFLNQVIVINTEISPEECLKISQEIEIDMGRVRYERWGPRIIDVDILFYNDLVKQDNELIIPHAQLHKRRFTLVPLHEVLPQKIHPIFRVSVAALLEDCKDPLEVNIIEN